MSETTLTKPKRKTNAHYAEVLDRLLADMRSLNEVMQSDRVEIDRLKAETQLIREDSKRISCESTLLREESMRLQAETRATLSRIRQALG